MILMFPVTKNSSVRALLHNSSLFFCISLNEEIDLDLLKFNEYEKLIFTDVFC